MADGSTTILLPVPLEALKRLRDAERRQRAQTKKDGLPAEYVSVEGLLLLQQNKCGKCSEPLDFMVRWNADSPPPLYPVIAHKFLRKRGGGHVPSNVAIWHHRCNQVMAGTEKRDTALGDRMAIDWSKKLAPAPDAEPELMKTRHSRDPRGWQKPAGYISPLSKKYRQQVKARVEGK